MFLHFSHFSYFFVQSTKKYEKCEKCKNIPKDYFRQQSCTLLSAQNVAVVSVRYTLSLKYVEKAKIENGTLVIY